MEALETVRVPLLQSYIHPAADVHTSERAGTGVFANAPISKGEVVAMWGGVVYQQDAYERLSRELKHYLLQIDEHLYIGPSSMETVDKAEYFNHSCEPNLGFRGQIALVAMRDIMAGEELTFDYAMAETYDQEWTCNCGSRLCRQDILGTDHELPTLRHRYRGYFSAWLANKHTDIHENDNFMRQFEETGAWGIDTNVDLHDCDPDIIRDPEAIRQFTIELCERLKVNRFGEPVIVHFGEDERVAGYSLVQLIETSLVSGHFANLTNRVYLDIFSCAYYDPEEAARFSGEFFKAGSMRMNTELRH